MRTETLLRQGEELYREYAFSIVNLETDIRFFRLEGKQKDKVRAMRTRDDILLKMDLLEQYIKEITDSSLEK